MTRDAISQGKRGAASSLHPTEGIFQIPRLPHSAHSWWSMRARSWTKGPGRWKNSRCSYSSTARYELAVQALFFQAGVLLQMRWS